MSDDARALIVPLNVLALIVSNKDIQNGKTKHFSGMNVDYSRQDHLSYAANLGANVVLPLDFPVADGNELQAGVHLHWELPDILMKDTAGEKFQFPVVPNRWLVHRIQIQSPSVGTKEDIITRVSWVISSDKIQPQKDPQTDTFITLPVSQDNSMLGYCYCGKKEKYVNWMETNEEGFKSLNATSSGLPAFSTFYPNCRGIFGFHDPLTDIIVPNEDKKIRMLMYTVTGWYSPELEKEDPLRKKYNGRFLNTRQEIENTLGWTFHEENNSEPTTQHAPYYSLYHGSVQEIGWNPEIEFLPDAYTKEIPTEKHAAPIINTRLSVGNNYAEAVATYLCHTTGPTILNLELFLTLYLLGVEIPNLNPSTLSKDNGILKLLRDKQHEYLFRSVSAERNYLIVNRNNANQTPEKADYLEIPDNVIEALNQFNYDTHVLQILNHCIENEKWQLFADWYRIFFTSGIDKARAETIANRKNNQLGTLIQNLENERNKTKANASIIAEYIKDHLTEYALHVDAAPRYWRPNDPVFLLEGENLETSRYGSNAKYISSGYLQCRLETQLVTTITNEKSQKTFDASGLDWQFDVSKLKNRVVFQNLLRESLILNAFLLMLKTNYLITFEDLQQLLATNQNNLPNDRKLRLNEANIGPSLISLNEWGISKTSGSKNDKKNQWVPVFIDWEIEFEPFYPISFDTAKKEFNNYPQSYPYTCFAYENGVDLDIHGGNCSLTNKPSRIEKYTGTSLLSPDSVNEFRKRVEKIKNSSIIVLKDKFPQFQQQMGKNILIQSFDNLTDYFLMRNPSLQLDINVPNNSNAGTKELTDKIRKTLTNKSTQKPDIPGTSPLIETDSNTASQAFYNPFRAGKIKSIDMTLIDVFGQKRKIKKWSSASTLAATQDKFFFSQTLFEKPMGTWDDLIRPYFAPRICQPARLSFRLLAANTTKLEEMTEHPASNPICGWLLFNRVNQSFFVHDAQGICLGSLFINDMNQVIWRSAPGKEKTHEQDLATAMPVVRSLVEALIKGTGEFFAVFRDAIDHMQRAVVRTTDVASNNIALTLCRPIAIVQASLSLELQGSPIYNQSLKTLEIPVEEGNENQFSQYGETDNQFSEMKFSVEFGNKLDKEFNNSYEEIDGLFGFFKFDRNKNDYNFDEFYTYGAHEVNDGSKPPVQRPNRLTILLKPFPHTTISTTEQFLEAQNNAAEKILMLVDPYETIHAFSGFLPMKKVNIPADMYRDTVNMLGLTFLAAPVLTGATTLDIPLPDEPEYEWTWTTLQTKKKPRENNTVRSWVVQNKINTVMPEGLWNYTPQKAQDGWLQAIPHLLSFKISNKEGNSILMPGDNYKLKLRIMNHQLRSIKFTHGTFSGEHETPKNGSIFYIRFSAAIKASNVEKIWSPEALEKWHSEKWEKPKLYSDENGPYWALIPKTSFVIKGQIKHPTAEEEIIIDHLIVENNNTEVAIDFKYFNIINIHDGSYRSVINVQ